MAIQSLKRLKVTSAKPVPVEYTFAQLKAKLKGTVYEKPPFKWVPLKNNEGYMMEFHMKGHSLMGGTLFRMEVFRQKTLDEVLKAIPTKAEATGRDAIKRNAVDLKKVQYQVDVLKSEGAKLPTKFPKLV